MRLTCCSLYQSGFRGSAGGDLHPLHYSVCVSSVKQTRGPVCAEDFNSESSNPEDEGILLLRNVGKYLPLIIQGDLNLFMSC